MKNLFHFFFFRTFFPLLVILLLASQIIYSQTWVRKVDGFSMWSIGKDYAGNIYAGTTGSNRGIFKSTDGGDTWTNVFSTGASNYLYITCDSLNNVWVGNVSNGLIYSTDGGQNFTTIPASTFGGNNVNSVACGKNGHIFVGVTNGGVWRSTDFGATFTQSSLNTITIVEIKVDRFNSDIIYAGGSSTSLNGFFISTDDGQTFGTATNSVNVWEILQTSSNEIYTATTTSPYPFDKSTDGGLTWTTLGFQPGAMRGATLDLIEDIYISGNGGVFKSTNGGTTFINHNLTFSTNEILTYDNKIMVCATGTTNGGVWIYTDSTIVPVELSGFAASVKHNIVELNWKTATELNNSGFEILRQVQDENNWKNIGFVPGYGTTTESHSYSFIDSEAPSGIYFYRLKQIDFDGNYNYSESVRVEVIQPLRFGLEQNYPNPFNPSTKIIYSIPYSSIVSLKVYDVLGNEVDELVNETKTSGNYEVNFNAEQLPSGVYFYQLKVGNPSTGSGQEFIETKKMILLR
jgi:photosystem II stability/assembly factor-like uncharacterized protein